MEIKLIFFGKIKRWRGKGIYVPKKLIEKNNFSQENCRIYLEKIDGFHKKVGSDGRIYLPNKVAKELNIKSKDIIKLQYKFKGNKKTFFKPIRIRKRENTIEYFLMLGKKFGNKEGIFKILNVFRPNSKENKLKNNLDLILKDLDYIIDEDTIYVFDGAKKQVKINKNIDIESFCYYLGAYLADGIKRDEKTWGICASTLKQAKYYIKKHRELIKNPKIKFSLSYTSLPGEDIDKIKEKWESNLDININYIQTKEIKEDLKHRNDYGTLVLKEHKRILPIIYNSFLEKLVEKISVSKNKQLCWDFILGVFEGDGAANARTEGYITIFSNPKDSKTIKKLLKAHNIEHRIFKKSKNSTYIRIGTIELLNNLDYIAEKLFCLYPKRRKKAIKRLADTGTGRFLLGKQDYVTNWVGKELRDKNILDEENEFTSKGKRIKEIFDEMYREIQEDSLPENEVLLGLDRQKPLSVQGEG